MALTDPPVFRVFNGSPAEVEANMNLIARDYALHLFIPGVLSDTLESIDPTRAAGLPAVSRRRIDQINVTAVMILKASLTPPRIQPGVRLN